MSASAPHLEGDESERPLVVSLEGVGLRREENRLIARLSPLVPPTRGAGFAPALGGDGATLAWPPLRVMVLGGDPAVWRSLTDASGVRPVQVHVDDLDGPFSASALREVDAVIVPARPGAAELPLLEALARRGVTGKTVVLGKHDRASLRRVLELGVAAYVSGNLERLRRIVEHVASGGAYFDAPAAAVARRTRAGARHLAAAEALASALEAKDAYTGGHAERVTALALRLASAVGTSDDPDVLETSFLLHDVGKIGIPDSILTKRGALTPAERRVLETHPILGERIIAPMGFPCVVRHVVRHHHERWDGSGYPDGLEGEDIPLVARIFSIADAFDAMTSSRPYRRAIDFDEAVRRVLLGAGSQFDPTLAALAEEVFLDEPVELLPHPVSPLATR